MLSEYHTIHSIANWLTEWQQAGGNVPKEAVCDFSLALFGGLVKAFTPYSDLKHVNQCFGVLTKKSKDSQLPPCFIRVDVAHCIKLISRNMQSTAERGISVGVLPCVTEDDHSVELTGIDETLHTDLKMWVTEICEEALSVSGEGFTCDKCREVVRLTEKILELESRIQSLFEDSKSVRTVENILDASNVSAHSSVPVENPLQLGNFVTEAVAKDGLQSRAKSLVHQIIRLSGPTLSKCCRDEVEVKLIHLAESSEEARREMRVTMNEEMIRMHNRKRYHQKLIDVSKFTERFPTIFLVDPLWRTLDPENPGECLPPSPAEAPTSDVMSDSQQFVPLVEPPVLPQAPAPPSCSPAHAHQEAVMENDIKIEAKALVRKLIRVTGRDIYKELREETEIKIVELADSSMEACFEVRATMTKGMIQMHKSKRLQQKLMEIYKFIARVKLYLKRMRRSGVLTYSCCDAVIDVADCKSLGALYLPYVEKTVKPEVTIRSVRQASGTQPAWLICSAYDFYPKFIKMTRMRDDEVMNSDVTLTEEMADGDWYYQIHSNLEYFLKPGEKITCVVEHASSNKPMIYHWGKNIESHK
ncbi:120.7 kDa protein in NOF-FB transposable element [Triplophysa tibetana]|uniref:120.7 kDa protein in NOF-FB transposable element n=1 Tax=Triplophysa tibetana TaxID=1572043 RepID=A0A5A9NU61_9TELE|nr:120.7 kDa protein in NOF-FB transposable element [Triplophysa tibetana]